MQSGGGITLKIIAQETAICRIPPIQSSTGDRKKHDISLTDQQLSTLCFYGNIRGSNFMWAQHFDIRCVRNAAV
jgi:hypothetical protein